MGCKPDPVKREDEVVNNDIPEYKIIVIGDSGVGKTAIIHQYITGRFGDTTPTLGVANQIKEVNVPRSEKKMSLDIWDTAGQDDLKNMTQLHYNGSHAVVIVCSVDKIQTFKSIDNYKNIVDSLCGNDVIVALAGNKCDLQSERRVSFDDLTQKSEELDCMYFETSAMADKRDTIEDMFNEIIIQLKEKEPKKSNVRLSKK